MMKRTLMSILPLLFTPLVAGIPARVHTLAQVGDGGGIRTVFLVSNANDQAARVHIQLYQSDGSGFPVVFGSGDPSASFEDDVPARGSLRIVTEGAGQEARDGWAMVWATRAVAVQAFFEIRVGGRLVTQAVVEPAGFLHQAEVFVDNSPGSRTGIAAANLFGQGKSVLALSLRNAHHKPGDFQIYGPALTLPGASSSWRVVGPNPGGQQPNWTRLDPILPGVTVEGVWASPELREVWKAPTGLSLQPDGLLEPQLVPLILTDGKCSKAKLIQIRLK